MTRQPTSVPIGAQEPRIRIVSKTASCDRLGDAALGLVDRLGPEVIDLMPWQEGSVLDICATDDQDQFAASAACEVVSRQNGKGGVLEVRAIAGITLKGFREKRILWTAHTWKTARDAHERVANIFLSHPDLKARLKGNGEPGKGGIGYGNDSRSINLKDGSQILFFTRSNSAGRGLWADLLIIDEAFDVTDGELSALRYTLRTAALRTGRRAQTIYTSTPPDEEIHHNGVVFARLRKRAMAGAKGVTWIEFSVPSLKELTEAAEAEGRRLIGDPRLPPPEHELPPETVALWARGNPSLGYLFDLGTLLSDRTESDDREFLVEGLAAPDYWPDPDASERAEHAIDFEAWKARRDAASRALDPVVVGLDVSPGRTQVANLSVAGWRADGRMHGELVMSAPGTAWVLPALTGPGGLIESVDPAALIVDGRGPAGSLLPEIRAAGLDPRVLTSSERAQADDGLAAAVRDDQIRLPGEPMLALDAAAEAATWRESGDVRYFDRRSGGPAPSPVVSLALARFGLLEVAAQPPKPKPRAPEPIKGEPAAAGRELDLMSAGF